MLCTEKFFNSKSLPLLDISEEKLLALANESVNKGLTVPGVQKKLSLHLEEGSPPRLTLVDYPAGYILKPPAKEYPSLPEAEDLVMDMASAMGIRTVPHGLLPIENGFAYITKRVDRKKKGSSVQLFAMEDFCQLSERLTQDKYKSSYEQCAKIIQRYSAQSGLDMSEFFLRIVVSFLTGNSDMHLKNFSLMETAPKSRQFVLSPAYDLLPVKLVLPEDQEETALTLNGKKKNIGKKDFLALASACSIPKNAALKMIDNCIRKQEMAEKMCEESYLTVQQKEAFLLLMKQRFDRLR